MYSNPEDDYDTSDLYSKNHICALDRKRRHVKSVQRRIFDFITVSRMNPLCNLYFRSDKRLIREWHKHRHSAFPYVIHPFSKFKLFYDIYALCLYILVLICKPIDIAFINVRFLNSRSIASNLWFAIDVFCWMDIAVNFFIGYYDSKTKSAALNPIMIAKKYAIESPYFLCDFLSSLPKRRVYVPGRNNRLIVIRVFSILQLLKFIRLYTVHQLYGRTADFLHIKYRTWYYISSSVLVVLLTCHWLTCAQFFVNRLRLWYFGYWHEDLWVTKLNLTHADFTTQYVTSLHLTAEYVFSINVRLEYVVFWEQYVMTTITLVVGHLINIVIWVSVISVMVQSRSSEIAYQEFVDELIVFMEHKQIPETMSKRLIDYYDYKYLKNYYKDSLIRDLISRPLKTEIHKHDCKQLIQSVSLFRELSSKEVSTILNYLVLEIYLPHDVIVEAGELGDSMYFVSSGTVAVYTHSGKEVYHLTEGAYFGEISLLVLGQKRNATVKALEMSELYRLDYRPFQKTFMQNPYLLNKLLAVAKERVWQMSEMDKEHRAMLFKKNFMTGQ